MEFYTSKLKINYPIIKSDQNIEFLNNYYS